MRSLRSLSIAPENFEWWETLKIINFKGKTPTKLKWRGRLNSQVSNQTREGLQSSTPLALFFSSLSPHGFTEALQRLNRILWLQTRFPNEFRHFQSQLYWIPNDFIKTETASSNGRRKFDCTQPDKSKRHLQRSNPFHILMIVVVSFHDISLSQNKTATSVDSSRDDLQCNRLPLMQRIVMLGRRKTKESELKESYPRKGNSKWKGQVQGRRVRTRWRRGGEKNRWKGLREGQIQGSIPKAWNFFQKRKDPRNSIEGNVGETYLSKAIHSSMVAMGKKRE